MSAARTPDRAGRTMRGAPLSLPSMPASRPKSLPQCAGAGAVRWPRRAVTSLHQGGKAGGPCGKARGLSSSSARVYGPLEVDDFAHRLPVRRPAPLVEFRLAGAAEIETDVAPFRAQQEPALLLTDAHRALIAADVARRQAVPQPPGRLADELEAR